jgi:hypothetical protein
MILHLTPTHIVCVLLNLACWCDNSWASMSSQIPESCTYEQSTLSKPTSDVTVGDSTLNFGSKSTTGALSYEVGHAPLPTLK